MRKISGYRGMFTDPGLSCRHVQHNIFFQFNVSTESSIIFSLNFTIGMIKLMIRFFSLNMNSFFYLKLEGGGIET